MVSHDAISPTRHFGTPARSNDSPFAMHNATSTSGLSDIAAALHERDLWWFLGWQDIKQRYRRSVLGPWWLTLSTGVLIGTLGFLWSELFRLDVRTYLPFFSVGLVLWIFVSGLLGEACGAFPQFDGMIKQLYRPYSVYVLRIAVRHFIVLLHNAVIIVVVLLATGPQRAPLFGAIAVGVCLVVVFSVLSSICLAIVCLRFRDLSQVVASLLQVIFYTTPILWSPDALSKYRWVAEVNPFAHLIDVLRLPVLGVVPSLGAYAYVAVLIACSFVLALFLLSRYRWRLAYWL